MRDGIRRRTIFGAGLEQAEIRADKQWVFQPVADISLYLPSPALRDVIAR
jgi:hypothetical protein